MINKKTFIFDGTEPVRIDVFLSAQADISRTAAARMLESGSVTLAGKHPSKNYKLQAGDALEVVFEECVESGIEPQNIPLDIVYEDNDLLVVNKPKGLVVHPAPGNLNGTLVNALLYHCGESLSGIGGVIRPGIVHRIDKDTSGLLMVAKNDAAHISLSQQIKEHSFTREYEAVVHGNPKRAEGTVNAPIGRHPVKRKQMAVTASNSKVAVTDYKVLEYLNGFAHLRLKLHTGRTHQIRVHMSYIGHPVAGDSVYGPRKAAANDGQILHAKKLGFVHPRTGEYMEFETGLPDYFTDFISKIKGN